MREKEVFGATLVVSSSLGHLWAVALSRLKWPRLREALRRYWRKDWVYLRDLSTQASSWPGVDYPAIGESTGGPVWEWTTARNRWTLRVDKGGIFVRLNRPGDFRPSEFTVEWGAPWDGAQVGLGDIEPRHAWAIMDLGKDLIHSSQYWWFLPGAEEVEILGRGMVKVAEQTGLLEERQVSEGEEVPVEV